GLRAGFEAAVVDMLGAEETVLVEGVQLGLVQRDAAEQIQGGFAQPGLPAVCKLAEALPGVLEVATVEGVSAAQVVSEGPGCGRLQLRRLRQDVLRLRVALAAQAQQTAPRAGQGLCFACGQLRRG